MREAAARARLDVEALQEQGIVADRRNRLERDGAIENRVEGFVDLAHSPFTQE